MIYKVVICAECRRQAVWAPLDRTAYSWQCRGSDEEHGYKYLSLTRGTAIEIEVVPLQSAPPCNRVS